MAICHKGRKRSRVTYAKLNPLFEPLKFTAFIKPNHLFTTEGSYFSIK
jgi:hypothetical protein